MQTSYYIFIVNLYFSTDSDEFAWNVSLAG